MDLSILSLEAWEWFQGSLESQGLEFLVFEACLAIAGIVGKGRGGGLAGL